MVNKKASPVKKAGDAMKNSQNYLLKGKVPALLTVAVCVLKNSLSILITVEVTASMNLILHVTVLLVEAVYSSQEMVLTK